MILRRLSLTDFRSYERLEWEPAGQLNLVVGDNGSGKTNVLEAISLLAGLRLRHLLRDVDMVRRGADVLRVVGQMDGDTVGQDGAHEVAVALMGRTRRYLVNGLSSRPGEKHTPAIVAFTPDDLDIVKGAPEIRRQLLERDLGQISLGYRDLMRTYARAVAQRNALLRRIGQGQALPTELDPWDLSVARTGSAVQRWRANEVRTLQPLIKEGYGRLSEHRGILRVTYRPKVDLAATDEIDGQEPTEETLLRSFRQARAAEIARGHTLIGPQRDDLGFALDGREMRGFASQGEQRTAVVCVKLALLERLADLRGDRPLLVLDDVLSELDPRRQDRLLQDAKGYQTFVSSTVPAPGLGAAVVHAGGGRVQAWPAAGRRDGLGRKP